MCVSPLGDVQERRQTSLSDDGWILAPSNGMWMRQMKPQVSVLKKVGLACVMACVAVAASASDRDRAKRMYDRIAGVPPSEATLDLMEPLVASNPEAAAAYAFTDRAFYEVTLKNMSVTWTNRD